MDNKDHMAGILANTLLYTDAAQNVLVHLLWDRFSEAQKQALTDAAFNAAMDRVSKVVEARIFAVGTPTHGRVNMFARHVEGAIKRAFESANVESEVKTLVTEQLSTAQLNLGATVNKIVTSMVDSLVRNVIEHVDTYTIQRSLQDALKKDGN